ncbi:MAG: MucR family transcriptional regulator [Anderseniella sp.]
MQEINEQDTTFVELTTEIVCAYVGNNAVPSADIPALIKNVHAALSEAANSTAADNAPAPEPAVAIGKSIMPDYLICLEDGLKFKSLKRHLRTSYNLTPEEYREKWGLKHDYPMVAPNYAAERSKLAKKIGLGVGRRKQK